MYGTEYEIPGFNPFSTRGLSQHDAVCAVCHVRTRGSQLMIPGTYTCPSGWTREYHGYLMSEKFYHHSSQYICVDRDAEYVPGSGGNRNGALLYLVAGMCGALPCLPYVDGRQLTCAVCSK